MRLRAMPLPRDQFVIIIDRLTTSDQFANAFESFGDTFRENLEGCGGALLFEGEVECDGWYQVG